MAEPPHPAGPPPPLESFCGSEYSASVAQPQHPDGRGGSRSTFSTPQAPQPWMNVKEEKYDESPAHQHHHHQKQHQHHQHADSQSPGHLSYLDSLKGEHHGPPPSPPPPKQNPSWQSEPKQLVDQAAPPVTVTVLELYRDAAPTTFYGMPCDDVYAKYGQHNGVRQLDVSYAVAIFEGLLPEFSEAQAADVGAAARACPKVDARVRHTLNLALRYVGLQLVSTASGQTATDSTMLSSIFVHINRIPGPVLRVLQLTTACGHPQWSYGVLRTLFELRDSREYPRLRAWAEQALPEAHVQGLIRDLQQVNIPFGDAAPELPPGGGTTSYTILTANLEAFRHYDRHLAGEPVAEVFDRYFRVSNEARVASFVRMMREQTPDVACLQEADPQGWGAALAKDPDARTVLADYERRVTADASLMMLVRKPLRIADFKEDTGVRAHIAVIENQARQQRFAVLSTHARFGAMYTNAAGYMRLLKAVAGVPIIACGDFNTDYGATPMELYQQSGGNVNLEVMQTQLFPPDAWAWVADPLPFTARSVVGLDVFEKIDHVMVQRHPQLAGASLVGMCPPEEKANRLLPLAVTESTERREVWEVREEVRARGMRGSQPVRHVTAGEWDKNSPENHFSDHAAIVVKVDLYNQKQPAGTGAADSDPGAIFDKFDFRFQNTVCGFTHHPSFPGELVLVVNPVVSTSSTVVFAVPASPYPKENPANCFDLPADLFFFRSNLGKVSRFGSCILAYSPPSAQAQGRQKACAFDRKRRQFIFIDDNSPVPVAAPVAPPVHPQPTQPPPTHAHAHQHQHPPVHHAPAHQHQQSHQHGFSNAKHGHGAHSAHGGSNLGPAGPNSHMTFKMNFAKK